jgi:small conductance mechanosensitive channel
LAKLARRSLGIVLDRSRISSDLLLKDFFLRLLTISILLVSTLTALGTIGLDVRAFIAGLGITGLILGFALKDTLANFAAGLLLLIYRPFRAGQIIEVEGTQGTVEEITIVNLRMTTSDGVRVFLPNSRVWGAKITNISMAKQRRVELRIRVASTQIESAISTIAEVLNNDPKILRSPEPGIQVTYLSQSIAVLTIRSWSDPVEYDSMRTSILLSIIDALKRASIAVL